MPLKRSAEIIRYENMRKVFTVILRVLIAIITLYTPVFLILNRCFSIPSLPIILSLPAPLFSFSLWLVLCLGVNSVWGTIICISPYIVAVFGAMMCTRNKIVFRICTYLPFILSFVLNMRLYEGMLWNQSYKIPLIMDLIVLVMIVALDVLVPSRSKIRRENVDVENS